MEKLKQFINNDYNYFSNLGSSEVETYIASKFDSDVIEYLKSAKHNRFDYKGICVYYVEKKSITKDVSLYVDEVWVENMNN